MASSERTPRRRMTPEDRRANLLEAAAAEFAAHPYPEVTMAAIATRAGASEGLLYRYFPSKDDLYGDLVRQASDDLIARQDAAVAALERGASVRDRVRAAIIVHVDQTSSGTTRLGGAAAGTWEPEAARVARSEARTSSVRHILGLLSDSERARHSYAVVGFLGYLDAACARWRDRGCPESERWPLIDSALGSLEGALGDWAA